MHVPVMRKQVLDYLSPSRNENFIDCTFEQSGHSLAILKRNRPNGKVLAIERDPELYKQFQERGKADKQRLVLVNDTYANLKQIVKQTGFPSIKGILMDLGMSSWHLDESGKGFSFQKDEPLDMRYDPDSTSLTAYDIVNSYTEEDITEILKEYGQEKLSKQISRKIVEKRKEKPIRTTLDLVEIIWLAMPGRYRRGKIHPATKTFQALRIKVNEEIEELKKGLVQAVDVLEEQGCLVVISFHSLEDREVKKFFKRGAQLNILEILTKKPLIADDQEIKVNPRARSAKLRVVRKLI